MDYTTIASLLLSVLGWAVVYYASKWATTGQPLDYVDLASTLIVALLVGLVSVLSGSGITQQDLVTQIEVYAPVIAFVDVVLKAIIAYVRPPVTSPRSPLYVGKPKV